MALMMVATMGYAQTLTVGSGKGFKVRLLLFL